MRKKLSTVSLTLITVCSVDSIRNLPIAAIAGSQLLTYFSLALVFFLLPCAIVSAWFSSQSQQGIYGWVKQGLGPRPAFLAIWFQCAQNILIYPTFLSFIAGTLLYSVSPDLAENKGLIFLLVITMIWGLTWVNLKGIESSSRFNAFCSIFGMLVPFGLILLIGLYWWCTQVPSGQPVLPAATTYSWTSLTAIVLSFCGIELAAVHAKESQPGAFVRAMGLSVFIIFLTMLLGSITLAMIIPLHDLNFITSIPALIQLFFAQVHAEKLACVVNALIAIGCLGGANNWLIVPVKGMSFAAGEGFIHPKYQVLNANQMPASLLIRQAIAVTCISALFLIIPQINTSYWLLLNVATEVMLLMYILLFWSAIKVIGQERKYSVLIPAYLGLIGIGVALVVSLTPPPVINLQHQFFYALLSGFCLLMLVIIPLYNRQGSTKIIET